MKLIHIKDILSFDGHPILGRYSDAPYYMGRRLVDYFLHRCARVSSRGLGSEIRMILENYEKN